MVWVEVRQILPGRHKYELIYDMILFILVTFFLLHMPEYFKYLFKIKD